MRVVEHVERVPQHGRRHARGGETPLQGQAVVERGACCQHPVEFVLALLAVRGVCETRVPGIHAQDVAEPPPLLPGLDRDRDPGLRADARVDPPRREQRVAAAGAFGRGAADRLLDQAVGGEREHGLDVGEVDVLTLARSPAVAEGGQERRGGVDAGDRIAEGDVLHGRRVAGAAVQVGQSGRLLDGRAVGPVVHPGPALAEGRHRDHDELGVRLAEPWVVESQPGQDAGGVVLDHGIGLRDEAQQKVDAAPAGQVESDPQLVAAGRVEGGRLLVELLGDRLRRRFPAAPPVEVLAGLDLDHVGAEVGELAGGERPGPAHRQVDNADVAEQRGSARGLSVCGLSVCGVSVCGLSVRRPSGRHPVRLLGVASRLRGGLTAPVCRRVVVLAEARGPASGCRGSAVKTKRRAGGEETALVGVFGLNPGAAIPELLEVEQLRRRRRERERDARGLPGLDPLAGGPLEEARPERGVDPVGVLEPVDRHLVAGLGAELVEAQQRAEAPPLRWSHGGHAEPAVTAGIDADRIGGPEAVDADPGTDLSRREGSRGAGLGDAHRRLEDRDVEVERGVEASGLPRQQVADGAHVGQRARDHLRRVPRGQDRGPVGRSDRPGGARVGADDGVRGGSAGIGTRGAEPGDGEPGLALEQIPSLRGGVGVEDEIGAAEQACGPRGPPVRRRHCVCRGRARSRARWPRVPTLPDGREAGGGSAGLRPAARGSSPLRRGRGRASRSRRWRPCRRGRRRGCRRGLRRLVSLVTHGLDGGGV